MAFPKPDNLWFVSPVERDAYEKLRAENAQLREALREIDALTEVPGTRTYAEVAAINAQARAARYPVPVQRAIDDLCAEAENSGDEQLAERLWAIAHDLEKVDWAKVLGDTDHE
jgi:hypothetical protein